MNRFSVVWWWWWWFHHFLFPLNSSHAKPTSSSDTLHVCVLRRRLFVTFFISRKPKQNQGSLFTHFPSVDISTRARATRWNESSPQLRSDENRSFSTGKLPKGFAYPSKFWHALLFNVLYTDLIFINNSDTLNTLLKWGQLCVADPGSWGRNTSTHPLTPGATSLEPGGGLAPATCSQFFPLRAS